MDELIKSVVQRTGIGEDKARMAVDTVIGFLKGRLPAPIASQLDGVLGAGGGAAGGAGAGGAANVAGDLMDKAKGGLGGMFGGGNA
jgi:hypothetical protein